MNVTCDQSRKALVTSHAGLLILAVALVALLVAFRAHFTVFIAKGESMMPGLRSGDLVLVDKLAYRALTPKRGDIVVARASNDLIVKRVVGLPGEEVELRQGSLYVNQRPFSEEYALEPGWLNLRRGRLLEDRYALLGDNRSVSSDVFVHAVVAKDLILGKVVHSLRLWPNWFRPAFIQTADTANANWHKKAKL